MSRPISPQWRSIRFRLALRTYAPCGPSVRVVSPTKSRKIPTRKILPLLCASRWSGLLECPCSTRTTRTTTDVGLAPAPCQPEARVQSGEACSAAVASLGMGGTVAVTPGSGAPWAGPGPNPHPPGCTVTAQNDGSFAAHFNPDRDGDAVCGAGPSSASLLAAHSSPEATVAVRLDRDPGGALANVTVTLSGAESKWFGVGFGASAMAGAPYTIIVGKDGGVSEYTLGDHSLLGTRLSPSAAIAATTVVDGQRTVVLEIPAERFARRSGITVGGIMQQQPQRVDVVTATGTAVGMGGEPVKTRQKLGKAKCVCVIFLSSLR